MELNNIVGFKAIDADGNEQNVTVDEMVDMVATRMVSALPETSALSEISTLATAAATGNDVYENELPTVTDAANVRVLQSSGDAAQMTMQSLATKLGGLIGINDTWLRYRGNITTADQLDSIRISGLYIATSTVIPNVIWTGQFMVGFNKDGTVGFQIYINDNATTVKMRVFWWSKWFDWVRITTT